MIDDPNDHRFAYMWTQINPVGYHNYAGYFYGSRNQGILCFEAEQAAHDDLVSKSDVFQFPIDLSLDVAANELQPLRNELRARGYPSLWVTSPGPYQGVIRNIVKSCIVLEHVYSLRSDLFGDDLDVPGSSLSSEKRLQLDRIAGYYKTTINHNVNLEVTMTSLMERVPNIEPKTGEPLGLYDLVL